MAKLRAVSAAEGGRFGPANSVANASEAALSP